VSEPRGATFERASFALAIVGSVLVSCAVVAAALLYRGRAGEPYSVLNHFVSELGEPGVSRGAWLFNAGLVAAGVFFVPASIGLGLRIRGALAWVGVATGVAAGVFCAGVGAFPMNNLAPHVFTAMWFFRSGLVAILCFGVALLTRGGAEGSLPRATALFSLVAVAAYTVFLIMAALAGADALRAPGSPALRVQRPAYWPLAVSEWSVFFSTVLWFCGVGLVALRRAPAPVT
jgi:hypothetical membrane protein